jgi:hypothetical protein
MVTLTVTLPEADRRSLLSKRHALKRAGLPEFDRGFILSAYGNALAMA